MSNNESKEKPVILITGGSGLIGQALSEKLAPRFQVVLVDLKRPEADLEGVHWVECDLTEDASVADALKKTRDEFGTRLASVLHLAAYYDFSGEPSPLYNELTVEGTRRLLSGLTPFEVEQFVFSSSLLVMEPTQSDEEPLTEESPVRTEWDYPRSKIEAETALLNEHGAIPLVILRIAGVYTDECRSLPLSRHISRVYEEDLESYLFPGDADHGQPFVHLEDLVACFGQVIDHRESLSHEEIFLIAEPGVMSHEDLQSRLGELIHGRKQPTIPIPKTLAKAGAWAKDQLTREEEFIKPWMVDLADDHYEVRITKAREKLDWVPRHTLESRLSVMVDDLKANPKRWYEKNGLSVPKGMKDEAVEVRSYGQE